MFLIFVPRGKREVLSKFRKIGNGPWDPGGCGIISFIDVRSPRDYWH